MAEHPTTFEVAEARREIFQKKIRGFRSEVYGGAKYKPNAEEKELIGVQDAVLFWASESGVDNSTDDAGNSGLHKSVFDATTRADAAEVKLLNDSGVAQYVVATAIKAKNIIRCSGEQGFTHDAFVDYQDIFLSGENTFEFGNNFVVTKAQLESLADYYAKTLGVIQGPTLTPLTIPLKNKHIYTVTIAGRCWWFEPGEWYTLQIGGAGEREYIDSICECYSVQVEAGADGLGTTRIAFREVEQNWVKDSNAVARFLATGDPKWLSNKFGRVVVGAKDYLGVADYYCDGTADQTEIQAAINYIAKAFGAGVVELTEGQFNITAAIELNYNNIVLMGRGFNTVIEKNCNDYAIESVGGEGTEIHGVVISSLKVTRNASDENINQTLILATYSDDMIIEKVWVYNSFYHGIYIELCDDISILSNTATACANYGIAIFGSSGVPIRAKIIGNTARSNGALGIGLGLLEHSTISANTLDTNTSYGLSLVICHYNSITGNIARNNSNGIFLEDSDCNILSGNIATSNSSRGIYISNAACDKNVVTGNRATGNTTANFTNSGTGTTDSGNDWT